MAKNIPTLASHRQMVFHQNDYVAKRGGTFALPKGDPTHNKLTGLIAKAYAKTHPKAFIGNLLVCHNHREFMEGNAPATEEDHGEVAYPHFADFVVPVEKDATLEDLLRQYNDIWRKEETECSLMRKIIVRIYELGGEYLLWV